MSPSSQMYDSASRESAVVSADVRTACAVSSHEAARTCGSDDGAGLARTGTGNGWVRSSSGFNDLHQTIAVAANRTYTVSAWIRTSANTADGYLGLRTPAGQVLGERRFARLDGYTKVTATVSSGANTSLVVFAGLWATGDTWAQVDDVSVVAS